MTRRNGAVRRETRDGVFVVVIDRPDRRNAVDREIAAQLLKAFEDFERDNTAAAAVLYGAGGHFCAGADLRAISEGRGNVVTLDGPGPMGPTRLRTSKPVIAAIEGHAVAGGLELALWCDLRVAARDAVFGVFNRRWGVPLVDGGTVRLPRLVGLGRALDMILTGRPVSAEEAHRMGLVDRLTEPGRALEVAMELATLIARFPQNSLRADRASALDQWHLEERDALRHEAGLGIESLSTGEALKGARRFAAGKGRHGSFLDFDEVEKSDEAAG